jgi:HD-like signal output (HDOD) protein
MAITRLGTRIVRDLVITLAMRQIYQARSEALNQQFKVLWSTSVEVAAICRTLATTQSRLNPEQALLAGLIHNIGTLPILQLAEDQSELFEDQQSMLAVINDIQGKVGQMMLKFWNFPTHLIDVVSQWNNFSRISGDDADYVDLVQTAILHSKHTAMTNIPADHQTQLSTFHKLGLDSDDGFWHNEDNKNSIEETRQSLIAI